MWTLGVFLCFPAALPEPIQTQVEVLATRTVPLRGPGYFAAPETFGAQLVDLGDLDGDGRSEIYSGGGILYLEDEGRFRDFVDLDLGPNVDESSIRAAARIGDLDGDGYTDFALAEGTNELHVVFLNQDGGVREVVTSTIPRAFVFAAGQEALAGPGDVDGDGTLDLAWTSCEVSTGTYYIQTFFLEPDGTYRGRRNIVEAAPRHLEFMGDLFGIGRPVLGGTVFLGLGQGQPMATFWAIGSNGRAQETRSYPLSSLESFFVPAPDVDGSGTPGLVTVDRSNLTLSIDTLDVQTGSISVASRSTMGPRELVLQGPYAWDGYGGGRSILVSALALGDVDADGDVDVMVGDPYRKAVYTIRPSGVHVDEVHGMGQSIELFAGNYTIQPSLPSGPRTGYPRGLVALGDINADGFEDFAISRSATISNRYSGSVAVLFGDRRGGYFGGKAIDLRTVALPGMSFGARRFGSQLGLLGDIDGNGYRDLLVGSENGNRSRGQVFVVYMSAFGRPLSAVEIAGSDLGNLVRLQDFLGPASGLGDLDADGTIDVILGAPGSDDGGDQRGAAYTCLLNPDATVKSFTKIADAQGGFSGALRDLDRFGASVLGVGDVDGDGIPDAAIGAPGEVQATLSMGTSTSSGTRGPRGQGSVWILFLNSDGTVKDQREITVGRGGFRGRHSFGDRFGEALALLPDRVGNGGLDLAVGAPGLRVSGSAVGSVWLLDLDGTGRVRRQDRIDAGAGEVEFGRTVACAEDLDGNGTGVDLLVGSETTAGTGQVRVLFLEGSPSSRASHATRNGTGINPLVFVAVNEPVLGQTWRATVDLLRIPCASSSGILFGLAGTLQLPTSLGELLVSPPFLGITIGTENLQVPLPATVWYAGDVIHTQGFAWTCGGLVLLNAIDLHVGY